MIDWQPGIGDPSFWGWFTVGAYFASALLCLRAWRQSEAPGQPSRRDILDARVRRRFWLIAATVLILLGINKQLDLQSLLTAIGRALAQDEGWYDSRRLVQEMFIAAVVGAAAIIVAASLWLFRRGGRWVLLGQVGLIALCGFVILRAASFHHVDALISNPVGFLKLNHVLELGGIAVIACAAIGGGRVRSGRRA